MTARSIQDKEPKDKVTISFQLPARYALIIHEAAEHILQRDNGTAAYARKLVLDAACDDLGIPRIDVGTMDLPPDAVTKAARKLGLSPDEFIAQATRRAALETLGEAPRNAPRKRVARSGEYRATAPPPPPKKRTN